MNWAKGVIYGLLLIGLGATLAKNGEPRTDKYNFGITFIASIIEAVIIWYC